LIEQAIVEQEAYLSQEDVAAVNIHLPDLIIPKWSRNTGTTTSSKGKDQDNVGAMEGSTVGRFCCLVNGVVHLTIHST
jgi:hypothetical protein